MSSWEYLRGKISYKSNTGEVRLIIISLGLVNFLKLYHRLLKQVAFQSKDLQ